MKAQQLFQEANRASGDDFSGITATPAELWEGGYFQEAKLIVLRNIYYQSKGLPTIEEQEIMGKYGSDAYPSK